MTFHGKWVAGAWAVGCSCGFCFLESSLFLFTVYFSFYQCSLACRCKGYLYFSVNRVSIPIGLYGWSRRVAAGDEHSPQGRVGRRLPVGSGWSCCYASCPYCRPPAAAAGAGTRQLPATPSGQLLATCRSSWCRHSPTACKTQWSVARHLPQQLVQALTNCLHHSVVTCPPPLATDITGSQTAATLSNV